MLRPSGVCIYSRWPERLSEVNWPAGDQRLREDKATRSEKPDKRVLLAKREQFKWWKYLI